MVLVGITGTNGSGKGETVWETVARGCRCFEFTKSTIQPEQRQLAPVPLLPKNLFSEVCV